MSTPFQNAKVGQFEPLYVVVLYGLNCIFRRIFELPKDGNVVCGRPKLKDNTEQFWNGLVTEF